MKERLKHMKETLATCIEGQLSNLSEIETEELGQAIDMLKDLEEAIYYCTIVEAMDKEEPKSQYKQSYQQEDYYQRMRDMDRDLNRMYYSSSSSGNSSNGGNSGSSSNSSGNSGSSNSSSGSSSRGFQNYDMEYPFMRDYREGRSPKSRKMYMEHKQAHSDKMTQMSNLDSYMQELASDIVEMIEGASQDEKMYLSEKISALASRIKQNG